MEVRRPLGIFAIRLLLTCSGFFTRRAAKLATYLKRHGVSL